MPFIGVSRCKGPTPQVQAQPVGPKCHRALRDSLYKGEAYYNRTQAGDVRRPYGAERAQRSPPRQWPEPHATPPERAGFRSGCRSSIPRPGTGRKGNWPGIEGARSAAIRIRICCGVWWSVGAVAVAHGGHVECPGRPLYLRPALSSVCAGGMHGPQPQCDLLEACVWEHVKALLSDPTVLRTQYEQGRGDPAVDVRAEQERADAWSASSPPWIGK